MEKNAAEGNPVSGDEHGKALVVFIVETFLGAVGVPLEILAIVFPIALLWAYPQAWDWIRHQDNRRRWTVAMVSYFVFAVSVVVSGQWYRATHKDPITVLVGIMRDG